MKALFYFVCMIACLIVAVLLFFSIRAEGYELWQRSAATLAAPFFFFLALWFASLGLVAAAEKCAPDTPGGKE